MWTGVKALVYNPTRLEPDLAVVPSMFCEVGQLFVEVPSAELHRYRCSHTNIDVGGRPDHRS